LFTKKQLWRRLFLKSHISPGIRSLSPSRTQYRERACELFEKQHRLFMNQRMPPARIIFNARRPDCSTGGGGDDDKGEISALGAQERVSLSTQKGGASVLHFAQIMKHPQTETRKGRRTIGGKCEMYRE
jgi:hypothetical protein